LSEEADEEESAMREAALFDPAEVSTPDEGIAFEDQATEILNKNELSKKTKHKAGLYATLALILIISSVSFTWVAVEKPSGIFNTVFSLFSEQSNSGKASVTSSSGEKRTNYSSDLPELQEGMKLLEQKRFTEAIAFFEKVLTNWI